VGDKGQETPSEDGIPAIGRILIEDFRDSFLKRSQINNGGS
jgi:hypothetical protein